MIKRNLRLIVALVLCLALLSGCTNSKVSTDNSSDAATTENSGDTSSSSGDTSSAEDTTPNNDTSSSDDTSSNDDTTSSGDASSGDTQEDSAASIASAEEAVALIDLEFDEDDYYNSEIPTGAIMITLNKTTAAIEGSGATADGSDVIITAAGTYVITGTLADGQIIVKAGEKDDVQIILNGVTIHCSDSAPIYIQSADKVVLSLQKGTVNTLTDTDSYVLADSAEDEPNSTIFSKSDLVINGSGSLVVEANYNNAITSKDYLKITDAKLQITSVDDGIIGKDMLVVKDASITMTVGGDGLKSTNEEDTAKGYLYIEGGTFNITAGTDGIQAVTSVLIANADIQLTTGGGSKNASITSGGGSNNQWGMWGNNSNSTSTSEDSTSAKGIKSDGNLTISSGSIHIDSSDDAIHATNLISITGGTLDISSGDDGIHADTEIEILGGTITITKSYEGIESVLITIDDGNVEITASDDGINVAGGVDSSSTSGRPGQNMFSMESSGGDSFHLNGGYLYIDAGGDGLDSNGSINITGGTAVVNGPTDDGNAPMDYASACEITGGYLIAAGSSGMAQAPSDSSSQNSIGILFTSTLSGGTLVHVEDSKGNDILTFAPSKQFASLVISSPDLEQGETYSIYTGGSSTGDEQNGLYSDGSYKSGEKMVEFTLSSVVTWVNESGITEFTGGFGGMGGGGFGGGGFGGGRGGKGH